MFADIVTYVAVIIFVIYFISRITIAKTKSNVCLVGKTVLITGGNSGIGYQTALILAGRGARVIIADKDDASSSKDTIMKYTRNKNIVAKYLDLASLQSVRDFAKDINETEERLDVLINNAGIGPAPREYTDDGLPIIMQVNHFGGFLLTHLLVELLKKSAPSRIIFTSSGLAFSNYLTIENLNKTSSRYSNSKLCNIITANGFAAKLKEHGVTCNSAHPGLAKTPIFDVEPNVFKLVIYKFLSIIFSKSAYEAAQTIAHCALSTKLKDTTGEFFCECRPFLQPAKAKDQMFCERIWALSEELVRLTPSEKI